MQRPASQALPKYGESSDFTTGEVKPPEVDGPEVFSVEKLPYSEPRKKSLQSFMM